MNNSILISTGYLFLSLLFFNLSLDSFGQDKIHLLKGKTIQGNLKVVEVDEEKEAVYYEITKNGVTKDKKINIYRVFSIEYENGNKEIIYLSDNFRGNYLSNEEMQLFVYGEQDARKNFKSPVFTILGLLYGSAGGYIVAGNLGPVMVILVPLSFVVVPTIFRGGINPDHVRKSRYLGETPYIMGFDRIKLNKRLRNAFLGSVIGASLGLAAFNLL